MSEATITHTSGAHLRIQPAIWKAIRAEATDLDLTAGELVTLMWRAWLDADSRRLLVNARREVLR